MGDIRISESAHGPAGARRYDYVPTYILRGLTRLDLEFTPRDATLHASRRHDDRRGSITPSPNSESVSSGAKSVNHT